MIDHWQQRLTEKGAIASLTGAIEYFSAFPFPSNSDFCITELGGLASYDLVGADAHKFLQGQITQDTKLLERQIGFLADHCTPKGRILGTLLVLPVSADHIRIILPVDNAERVIDNLKKYLVFSKAKLSVAVDCQTLLVEGKEAKQRLESLYGALPEHAWHTSPWHDGHILQIDETSFVVNVKTPAALNLIDAEPCQLAGWRHWQAFLITQGIGWVDSSNSEQFTPHQINHQFIGAISFKKGCYTGQEVVARMHYKATPKSHLYAFRITADSAPTLGCAVNCETTKVGKLLWLAQSAQNEWLTLAEVRIESADQALHLDSENAEKLHQIALPYAINK